MISETFNEFLALSEGQWLNLVWALMTGIVFGAIFFAGLWWTLRKGLGSDRSPLWFLISLLLRTGVTVFGFYLVGAGQWQRLLACLLGFLLVRFSVTRVFGTPLSVETKIPEPTLPEAFFQKNRLMRDQGSTTETDNAP